MSDGLASAMEAPRRHLTERQAGLVQRLVEAAAEEVEDHGYGPITVRSIAKRAGVATATAYTYFSSKDHLLCRGPLAQARQARPPRSTCSARCPSGWPTSSPR